jgi:hypothetical protein
VTIHRNRQSIALTTQVQECITLIHRHITTKSSRGAESERGLRIRLEKQIDPSHDCKRSEVALKPDMTALDCNILYFSHSAYDETPVVTGSFNSSNSFCFRQ